MKQTYKSGHQLSDALPEIIQTGALKSQGYVVLGLFTWAHTHIYTCDFAWAKEPPGMTILPIEYINKSFGFNGKMSCLYKKLL